MTLKASVARPPVDARAACGARASAHDVARRPAIQCAPPSLVRKIVSPSPTARRSTAPHRRQVERDPAGLGRPIGASIVGAQSLRRHERERRPPSSRRRAAAGSTASSRRRRRPPCTSVPAAPAGVAAGGPHFGVTQAHPTLRRAAKPDDSGSAPPRRPCTAAGRWHTAAGFAATSGIAEVEREEVVARSRDDLLPALAGVRAAQERGGLNTQPCVRRRQLEAEQTATWADLTCVHVRPSAPTGRHIARTTASRWRSAGRSPTAAPAGTPSCAASTQAAPPISTSPTLWSCRAARATVSATSSSWTTSTAGPPASTTSPTPRSSCARCTTPARAGRRATRRRWATTFSAPSLSSRERSCGLWATRATTTA